MKKSRFAIGSGELAPHTLLRLMNWLDQHGALDQLSATVTAAVDNWLDLQQAQDNGWSGPSTLAELASPPTASASPVCPSPPTTNGPAQPPAGPLGEAPPLAVGMPMAYRPPAAPAAPDGPAAPGSPGALAASRLASGRGYFWKALFLPEGTRLRVFMRGGGQAEVIGNELVYEGLPTSPNQFLRRFRGIPRNAWEELCIRFPGEKSWRRARELRRELGIPRRRGSILP